MPKWVEDCVKSVMDNPDFKPQEGRTKKESAYAVCQARYEELVKGSTITLEIITEPTQFVVAAEEEGEVLRFHNAILAVAETNKNRDTINDKGITEIAATLPGRAIDMEHDFRKTVGVFTAARAVKVAERWGVATDGLIWADRFPEAAEGIRNGTLRLSIEAEAIEAECSVCGERFQRFLDYCAHLKDKLMSGAHRILHGLKAVGGALTASPAGTDTDFDLSQVYLVASHQEGGDMDIETIDVLDDLQYEDVVAKKLSYQEREALKDSDFALIQKRPSKRDPKKTLRIRRFPIQNCAHARNALARLPQAKDLSSEERAQVKRKAQAKVNSKECKGETKAKGGLEMDELEKVQQQLAEMTKQYDEQFAAREQAESTLAAAQEELTTVKAKVEELSDALKEATGKLAETVMASRTQALILGGAMTEEEAEEAKETIAKMDDDVFDLLLAKAQEKSPDPRKATGGFTPGGDDGDGKDNLVL